VSQSESPSLFSELFSSESLQLARVGVAILEANRLVPSPVAPIGVHLIFQRISIHFDDCLQILNLKLAKITLNESNGGHFFDSITRPRGGAGDHRVNQRPVVEFFTRFFIQFNQFG
jgi:hypothetical protein